MIGFSVLSMRLSSHYSAFFIYLLKILWPEASIFSIPNGLFVWSVGNENGIENEMSFRKWKLHKMKL